jgi:hypothetical protein
LALWILSAGLASAQDVIKGGDAKTMEQQPSIKGGAVTMPAPPAVTDKYAAPPSEIFANAPYVAGTTDAWTVLRSKQGAIIGAYRADNAEQAYKLKQQLGEQADIENITSATPELYGFLDKQTAKASEQVRSAMESAVAGVCASAMRPSQLHVMTTLKADFYFAGGTMQFDFTWDTEKVCAEK